MSNCLAGENGLETGSGPKRLFAGVRFMFARWTTWVVLAVGLLLIALVIQAVAPVGAGDSAWMSSFTKYWDVPISIGTFVVALALGVAASYSRWQESLPLVLDVDIIAPKPGGWDTIIRIEHAPLGGPSDIRALSQQFASTFNGDTHVKLGMNYEIKPPRTTQNKWGDDGTKRWVRRYKCIAPVRVPLQNGSCAQRGEEGHDCCQWSFDPFTTNLPQGCELSTPASKAAEKPTPTPAGGEFDQEAGDSDRGDEDNRVTFGPTSDAAAEPDDVFSDVASEDAVSEGVNSEDAPSGDSASNEA